MRTLNVKKITKSELEKKWGFPLKFWGNIVYIVCNSKGEVNWDKASVYQAVELVDRGNYVVH